MERIASRLLTNRRWELNEKVEQFSALSRLRSTIERQLEAFGPPVDGEDDERAARRSHLRETLEQLDRQIEEARAAVAASARILRMLEGGGIGREAVSPS